MRQLHNLTWWMQGSTSSTLDASSVSAAMSRATQLLTLQAAGIWAATPTAPKTFVHESLLVAWHQHKHHNPNASLSGFLIARDKLADDHGALQVGNGSSCLLDLISHARCQADLLAHAAMQGLSHKRQIVQDCYQEYRRRKFDTRRALLEIDDLACPLCCFGGCPLLCMWMAT